MSDFLDYNAIKGIIEIEKCLEHNTYPKFIKSEKGFEINSCCEKFKGKLIEKVKKIVTEQTKSSIQQMMKKAFKK